MASSSLTHPALPRGLIVSCQAYEGEPMFGAAHMAAMARAAQVGGAVAIRANGPADIAAIRAAIPRSMPVIGLLKQWSDQSPVYITPTHLSAQVIAQAGADIIAIDATPRARAGGETLADLIRYIHNELGRPVMADTSCLSDVELALGLGADVISTTMAGYTEHGRVKTAGPDLEFLAQTVQLAGARAPVTAEGRFQTPAEVAQAFALGAHAVVIGAAITRPEIITQRFAAAIPAASR